MHVQLRHMSASHLKPSRFLMVIFLLGLLHLDFNQVLRHERNSLSSIPPTFPFTVCKPWLSARGMVLVALTAEYQECLKAGPCDVHYQCISAWLHCDCSTRMRCAFETHFFDINHLFTSTEKMHGMFQFHNFSLTW